MPPAKQLRAVKDGEVPERRPNQTVAQAAASGDQLALLVSMRDRIATAVSDPKCPPRDLASLTKRLADISVQISELRDAAEAEQGPVATDGTFDASAI